MIYNPRRGKLVQGIMILAVIASVSDMFAEDSKEQYTSSTPTTVTPSKASLLEAEIEEKMLAYDHISSISVSVYMNGSTASLIFVTVDGNGWRTYLKSIANEIQRYAPEAKVSIYDKDNVQVYTNHT